MQLLYNNKKFTYLPDSVKDFITKWNAPVSTIELKTSGTTGIPKIIHAKKEHLKLSAQYTGAFLELKENDTALCCLPVHFIAGKMMFVRAMELNLKLFYIEPTLHPLQKLTTPIDFCAMTPMQVYHSLDKIHLIKKLVIGGAKVPMDLKDKLKKFSTEIYETFAMTETYSHFALKKISQNSQEDYFSVFPAFEVSSDSRGCLMIKTPYFPEKLVTNDVVEIKDNTFVWLGREDFVINSGGIKLHPETIEQKLHPIFPSDFIVSSLPDKLIGEKVILIVENKDKSLIINKLQILKEQMKKVLHKYEVPKEIYGIEEFQRTPTEKIIRKIDTNKLTKISC